MMANWQALQLRSMGISQFPTTLQGIRHNVDYSVSPDIMHDSIMRIPALKQFGATLSFSLDISLAGPSAPWTSLQTGLPQARQLEENFSTIHISH
jgi:hypothetical protein